jgi:hypothetical protein
MLRNRANHRGIVKCFFEIPTGFFYPRDFSLDYDHDFGNHHARDLASVALSGRYADPIGMLPGAIKSKVAVGQLELQVATTVAVGNQLQMASVESKGGRRGMLSGYLSNLASSSVES